MLNKIFNSLTLTVHFLIIVAGIWVFFYAFEKILPSLIGIELFVTLYGSLNIIITLLAALITLLTTLYAIISLYQREKNH